MKKALAFILTLVFISTLNTSAQNYRKELKAYRKGGVEKSISSRGVKAHKVIKTAKSYIGVKHQMGGTSRKGMDCSGFVVNTFSEHGVELPRTSSDIGRYGRMIENVNRLKKGDLVFFHMSWNRKRLVNHIGIYIGDGEFIHVSSSKGCMISNINSEVWQKGFLFGTRVL